MARIVPGDITHLALSGAREPELATLHELRAALPRAYTVFHGVHWTREYRGHTVFGEIDFVVVNQAGKALLIEQKNGALDETESGLVKTYPDRPKSVADQVRRSLESVREKFKWIHANRSIELDYLIYCPDHRIVNLNAVGLDTERIVDAARRTQLCERIAAVLGAGGLDREEHAERVLAFFRQTFELVPDVHAHVTAQDRSFTRLSGGLVRLLDGLDMAPFRLRVTGTAGCGKTLIARHFFDRAVECGRRPLLVCFNRPLSERLKTSVRAGGRVTTFYGLCTDFLRERGRDVDFAAMQRDRQFWETIAERVIAEPVPDGWTYDTLIVDEGQDFEPIWVDILGTFLRERHDVLWLEDPDQNIREQTPVVLPGFVGYRARANYRSPESIARFILRTLPVQFECANDLPGLGVGVTPYADPAEQPGLVAAIVGRLLRQGFTHDDIVILTTRHLVMPGAERSVFAERRRVGHYSLRGFTGDYDLLGNQLLSAGQITFDSVTRFKGQQAPAVILVDVDAEPAELAHAQRLLFSGMTRATVRLELLVRGGSPLGDRLCAAVEPSAR